MTIIWIACNVKDLPQWYYDNLWYNALWCVLIEAYVLGGVLNLVFGAMQ